MSTDRVRTVVCVPDGCADEPVAELGGVTPLEYASTPTLDRLTSMGRIGRAAVIPPGLPPGSDVGNMAILGYDPALHHTGRAPIEAAAIGLRLQPDQVAFRCNLVTVGTGDDGAPAGTMLDFAGGHPSSEAAAEVIAALDAELGRGAGGPVSFHSGVQYRHTMVAPAEWVGAECTPPHDLTGQPAVLPTGAGSDELRRLMEASRDVLATFPGVAANQIWLWGQGHQPRMPSFEETHGCTGGLVTAVDLVRGLGVLTGMQIREVEGATGWFDTNYEGKRDAALAALADGADVFVIHVEASDEAGHAGDVEEKVRSLENWDRRILADLVSGLDSMGPWRMLLLPDHATPLARRTHTTDAVPYLVVDGHRAPGPDAFPVTRSGARYTERAVADLPATPGHELLPRLLRA